MSGVTFIENIMKEMVAFFLSKGIVKGGELIIYLFIYFLLWLIFVGLLMFLLWLLLLLFVCLFFMLSLFYVAARFQASTS